MRVLTINASDYTAGGAAGIAVELHKHALSQDGRSRMYVGKKTSCDESIVQIRRPAYTKILSHLLSNDIDFFQTGYLLEEKDIIDADIVHFHNVSGWYFNLGTLIKLSKFKPTIWTLHDMWALTPHCGHTSSDIIKNGLMACSDRRLYPTTLWNNQSYMSWRKSDLYGKGQFYIVTPCNWLREKVNKTCLSSKFFEIVPNGVDTKVFIPRNKEEIKSRLNISYRKVVVFVASDPIGNVYKGFSDFEWLADNWPYPDTEFIAVGSRSDGWQGKVRLICATQDKEKMSSYLTCADVLVLTSRHEVFPLVVLEALSCGVPVVAYDVGGVREAIDNLPGCRVVPPLDRVLLMKYLKECLDEMDFVGEDVAATLRQTATNKYSTEIMINSYFELYSHLIKLHKSQ